MAKKKELGHKREMPLWIFTFADMNNLLLALFVVLMSEATIEGLEARMILSSFSGNIGFLTGGKSLSQGQFAELGSSIESLPSRETGIAMSRVQQEARELFKPEIKSKKVKVTITEEGIKISLADDFFFESGSADIREELMPTIKKVADLISSLKDVKVDVIGHTDKSPVINPIIKEKFPSNWELSTARASSVVRALIDFGANPEIMTASGRAEFEPVESNDTPEGRAFNRRTDIYIKLIKKSTLPTYR
ncbi:MAG: OmpA family protein [Brevinematales bacterium]|nr:OmpA family protein [Brevinematales bacterium]